MFALGIISLIIFGLLLPQPIQALMVIVDSPIKNFFMQHAIILCITVGLLQGVSEECGYYFVIKKSLKEKFDDYVPFWFGLGRGLLHTIYDIGVVIASIHDISDGFIIISVRLIGMYALLYLTRLDYLSYRNNTVLFLLLSIIFHAVLNGVLYAKELELFVGNSMFDTWFMLVCSILIIVVSSIIWKYRDKVKQIG